MNMIESLDVDCYMIKELKEVGKGVIFKVLEK